MADATISSMTGALSVSRDDLMEVSQYENSAYTSASATLGQIVDLVQKDYSNLTVADSAWTLQSTPTFTGFPYVATITIQGVTTNDIAEVVPSISAINDGKLCPLNNTVANGVNIYASEAPSMSYTMERVTIRRWSGT